MVAAAAIAHEAGIFPFKDMERQNRLLAELELPTVYHGSIQARDILLATQLDKKVAGKRVQWVMPQRIGEVTVTPMPDAVIERVVTAFFAEKNV